jgi:hypothetical protein
MVCSLDNISDTHTVTAISVDEGKDDKINLMNIRGYGGVAIYWGENINHAIQVQDGNKPLLLYMYNLMLNSGKKICALHDKKRKYSNSCVVRKKNSERNKKP